MSLVRLILLTPLIAIVLPVIAVAQETAPADPTASRVLPQAERFAKFEKAMDGVVLTGQFTILGKEDQAPKPEMYEIRSIRKLEEPDLWLFNTRIKYGDKDSRLPIPIPVKWVGNTPVIALDNFTIPGMGTFSAYVVIDGDKYAGTWTHGAVTGHLFGRIEKMKRSDSSVE